MGFIEIMAKRLREKNGIFWRRQSEKSIFFGVVVMKSV